MATGFNTTAPTPYWIVRNSWSSTWGEYGYIYLEMAENTCGIADDATIPEVALDLTDDFSRIIDYFATEYGRGRTPNPCVRCNSWIKFGRLFDHADAIGATHVATGHYAQLTQATDGRPRLSRGLEAKAMWSPIERVWWDLQLGYAMTTFEDHRDARGAKIWDKQVPFVPRYTLRTGLTLDLGRGWSVNGSYQATGRTSYDERNTATFQQKAYGLVNAQLRYRVQGWTVAVYGHNLTDRQYDQFINPEIFAGSPGAPRRYGVQLTFEY